jgi:ABC-type phosphonate transport system ATPase subunit
MPPILALDKISKRFGAIVIADAIDLALAPREALGIIGPNGAGKTCAQSRPVPNSNKLSLRNSVAPAGCVGLPYTRCERRPTD